MGISMTALSRADTR